jgi:hypothetical protein
MISASKTGGFLGSIRAIRWRSRNPCQAALPVFGRQTTWLTLPLKASTVSMSLVQSSFGIKKPDRRKLSSTFTFMKFCTCTRGGLNSLTPLRSISAKAL